jgi:phage shock protein E
MTSNETLPTSRRSRRGVRIATVGVVALLGFAPMTMAACSSSDSAAGASAEAVASGAVLLDVRTPEEFASGHLEGAINIDVQSPDFNQKVAELDPSATYLVYCRSGNRSGQAIDRMEGLGFTDLTNIGSVAEANKATGVAVVS